MYVAMYGDDPEAESYDGDIDSAKDYFVSLLPAKGASTIRIVEDTSGPVGLVVSDYADGKWIDV